LRKKKSTRKPGFTPFEGGNSKYFFVQKNEQRSLHIQPHTGNRLGAFHKSKRSKKDRPYWAAFQSVKKGHWPFLTDFKMPLLLCCFAAQKSSLRSPQSLHSKAFGAFDPI
jgi:hypothetical protein